MKLIIQISSQICWLKLHTQTRKCLYQLDKISNKQHIVDEMKSLNLDHDHHHHKDDLLLKKFNLEKTISNTLNKMKGGVRKAMDRENYFKLRIERNIDNQKIIQQTSYEDGLLLCHIIEGRSLDLKSSHSIDSYCEIQMAMYDGQVKNYSYYKKLKLLLKMLIHFIMKNVL